MIVLEGRAEALQIEANVAHARAKLRVWAAHLSGRYNGPIYLLGSILHNPSPRDCDVRIVVPEHEFAARYGMETKPTTKEGWSKCIAWNEDGPTQRWIDDVAKFNGRLSVLLGFNMDVQVWPQSHWREKTYPTPILLAAPSSRWFVYNAHMRDPALLLEPQR